MEQTKIKIIPRNRGAKTHRVLFYSAIFLCLMPYLGPPELLPTDVQPYAVLVAVLAVIGRTTYVTERVPTVILPVFVISLFAFLSSLFLIVVDQSDIFPVVRSLWGYLTQLAILVFVWIYKDEILRVDSVARFLDVCLIVIFIGFLFQVFGLEILVQAVTSRAEFGLESFSSRGFSSFHPEQSRVSEQMLLFGVFYILLSKLTVRRALTLSFFGLISFAGQSVVSLLQIIFATSLALMIAFITSSVIVGKSNRVYLLLGFGVMTVAAIFLPTILNVSNDLGLPSRFVAALRNLSESPLALLNDRNAQIKFSGFIYAVAAPFGDPTVFDILAETRWRFYENVYPVGVAFSNYIFDVVLFQTQRPYTAIGQWSVHFGLIGSIFIILFLVLLFRICWNVTDKRARFRMIISYFILVQLLFLKLPLSQPTLWLVVGVLVVVAKTGSNGEPHQFSTRFNAAPRQLDLRRRGGRLS